MEVLCEDCVFALEHWSPAVGEFAYLNLVTGVDLSIRELAEVVATATGFQDVITRDISKPDGTSEKKLDVSRLAALGWRARIPLCGMPGDHNVAVSRGSCSAADEAVHMTAAIVIAE